MSKLIENLEKKLDETIELFKKDNIGYNEAHKHIINIERSFNRMIFDLGYFNLIDMYIVEKTKSQVALIIPKYIDRLDLINKSKGRSTLSDAFAQLLDFDFIGNM